ncbi:hypothetical protein C8J56DRAFT_950942 [Mycena floridula]|nr:hypothetical protein C8J56DRAFT_950942 [Mycena floridula]
MQSHFNQVEALSLTRRPSPTLETCHIPDRSPISRSQRRQVAATHSLHRINPNPPILPMLPSWSGINWQSLTNVTDLMSHLMPSISPASNLIRRSFSTTRLTALPFTTKILLVTVDCEPGPSQQKSPSFLSCTIFCEQWGQIPLVSSDLSSRCILIPGATSGLGLEVARHLAAMGPRSLLLTYRNSTSRFSTITQRSGVISSTVDLTSFASIKKLKHETTLQVNYLSNALLSILLLPHLIANFLRRRCIELSFSRATDIR